MAEYLILFTSGAVLKLKSLRSISAAEAEDLAWKHASALGMKPHIQTVVNLDKCPDLEV